MKQYIINHFHIRGNYIVGDYADIHDNPHAIIHSSAQAQSTCADQFPKEGHYDELVKWLDEQKDQGNDYYADAGFNRSLLCRNLMAIIGWEPNQDSLRKALNR